MQTTRSSSSPAIDFGCAVGQTQIAWSTGPCDEFTCVTVEALPKLAPPMANEESFAEASRQVCWEIDRDVIRGRRLDPYDKFLPDSLSFAGELGFLSQREQRLFGQVQGRTYTNLFRSVERFIGGRMLALGDHPGVGDESNRIELARRVERLTSDCMPPGYVFDSISNDPASFGPAACSWAISALAWHFELCSQARYRASIADAADLSGVFKDMFLRHQERQSPHASLRELAWLREDAKLACDADRNAAVADLIALVAGADANLQAQAKADARYFVRVVGMTVIDPRVAVVEATFLKAYRRQYIEPGVMESRFQELLSSLTHNAQMAGIQAALAVLMKALPDPTARELSPPAVAKAHPAAAKRSLFLAPFVALLSRWRVSLWKEECLRAELAERLVPYF